MQATQSEKTVTQVTEKTMTQVTEKTMTQAKKTVHMSVSERGATEC